MEVGLAQVDKGLKLEEQMKGDRADHNHEAAVKSAGAILDVFPDHTLARQTVKESGLIYRSLQTALASIRDCFDWQTEDGKPLAITVASEVRVRKHEAGKKGKVEETTKWVSHLDVAKIVYQLGKATEAADRAVQLDPQFERAIAAKKLNENVQAFVGVLVADLALDTVDERFRTCQMEYENADEWIRLGMKSPKYRSPWGYWGEVREYFERLAEIDEAYPAPIPQPELIAALLKLQTQMSDYFKTVAEPLIRR